MDSKTRKRKSRLVVNLGLFSNIILAILKTLIGVFGRSSALLAEGVNSVSDIVYYIVVRVFISLADKPPDREHPYGHRQFETIAALVVGAFVVTTGIAVFWTSAERFFLIINEGANDVPRPVTLYIGIGTVLFKVFMTLYSKAVARQTRNAAVGALARDHRNDVFSALAATVGILLARLGFAWVDPLAGAIVSVVIFLTGIQIVRESSADIMDTFPGEEIEESIRDYVLSVPHVWKIDEIHAHRIGPYLVIYLTIGVDGEISVREGDDIATKVENILESEIEYVRKVHIHFDPGNGPGG
jgi:cation diffusion facilitator family transporter